MTATTSRTTYPLARERNLILGSLLLLAAAAWGLLIWQTSVMDDSMSLTMGLGAPVFIALWIAMMGAIMFPTAAPMIMMFARVHRDKRAKGQPFVPAWIFTGAYILVWSATGLIAYSIAVAGDELASNSRWLADNAPRIGGAALIAAGAYQLSPVKEVCLGKCRSPMSFILNSWRDGYWGSFRMGLEHAMFCLGCCWLLFLVLFPLGMMNIAALAIITALIFAEKSLPIGRQAARLAAALFIVYGALVIAVPSALPTTMDSGEMSRTEKGSAPAQMGEIGVSGTSMPMER
ncbi:MAG TPA: DUF2182 domain-containing protein [Dehalococcoidia bacterium]|nr:DUF2182 domain-containing protein [Dehalococcoidia bacterium]